MRSAFGVAAAVVISLGCGASKKAAPCAPQSCSALHSACGPTSDGCGGTVDCGACGAGQACQANACVASACMPATCESAGASCGAVADGCGSTLSCGTCAAGSSCSQNACVVPDEQRGSTRWARTDGGGVDWVTTGFGHLAVLVDGGVLESWSTAGDKTSSVQIAPAGNDDVIVAGPSFVLARGAYQFDRNLFIRQHDWSGALRRTVASTNDYGSENIPAVSGAGRIAWTDWVSSGSPPPMTYSLHVENADGSAPQSWSSTDVLAGSVAFDPQGDVDVIVRAPHGAGSFFGKTFGASGVETALVQLDSSGGVRWTRDVPFSSPFPGIGTTGIGTIVLVGDGHLFAIERADGSVRFDVAADGRVLAVDPKGRVAVAGTSTVAYYDLTGALQWSRSFDATIRDVAIADDGSVLVGGWFKGTVDFGTGPLTAGPGGSGFVVDLAP